MTCNNSNICEDINECSDNIHGCAENAECINEIGTYTCQCKDGFFDDNDNIFDSCIDIDECTENIHGCAENAECFNENGTYTCQCKDGFFDDNDDIFDLCADIDECKQSQEEDTNYTGEGNTKIKSLEWKYVHWHRYFSMKINFISLTQ